MRMWGGKYKKKEQYTFKASKGWKRVIFKPEDCVW
jgi:hypothetical protein